MKCPLCEVGNLYEVIEVNHNQMKTKYSVCDFCGTEQANSTQINFNSVEYKNATQQTELEKNNAFNS